MNMPEFGEESVHRAIGNLLELWMLESRQRGEENSVNERSLPHV